MIDASGISNRHLLSTEGLAETPLHQNQSVRIVISHRWANSRAGQQLASCLVNLLCRQAGLIASIEVVAPAVPGLVRLPNGEAAQEFPAFLESLVAWAVKDIVAFSSVQTKRAVDHTIVIGDARDAEDQKALIAIGNGWRAWVGAPDRAPKEVMPEQSNPLGPFLAAALAAGEIFKAGRGILRGRPLRDAGFSLWSGQTSATWKDLEDGPEVTDIYLRPLHLVGAGAVGNDLAYILANLDLQDGYVVIIDDDSYDPTSLNRCLLAGWEDVTQPKVDAVSNALDSAGIEVFPFQGTTKEYLTSNRTNLRDDVARQVDELAFDIIVSCVDRGISRQDIQGLAPAVLMGASTLGLAARANSYPHRAEAACLACFNPAERDGEKIRAMEKQLRIMSKLERSDFLSRHGIDPGAVETWLADARCGTVGEAAVRGLATRTPSEFSVGFVSLGAALLVASMLLRHTVFSDQKPRRGDMNALNFLNGGMLDSYLAPDDACEWKCQERRGRNSEYSTTVKPKESTA